MTSIPKRRILIADDEPDLVEMLAMRLEASGLYEVEKACDGQACLERALSRPPDILLLDTVMPRLDGWEVCRRLRREPSAHGTAIVIMTAGTPRTSAAKAHEARADRLVLKPYDQAELLNILADLAAQAPQERSHAQAGKEDAPRRDRG